MLGLVWLASQKGLVIILGVVASGIVNRHLGPTEAGELAAAQALVGLFGLFAMGVDSTVFMDEMRRGQSRENAVMGGTTAVLALMGFVSWLLLVLYLFLYEWHSKNFALTAIAVGVRLLITFPAPVALWFQSRLMMREIVIPNTLGSIILRAWQITASLLGWGTVKIALGEVISLLCVLSASLSSYFKQGMSPRNWSLDWQAGFRVMTRSLPALAAAMLTALMSRMDILMVRSLRGENVAGIYSAASSLTESLLFVGVMITSVFVPMLIDQKKRGGDGYFSMRLDHLKLCAFAGWILAIALSASSAFLIHLIYGDSFKAASVVLLVHAFTLVPGIISSALQSHLTIEKKMRHLTLGLMFALIVNAGLNVLFIPKLGAPGAALASLVAYSLAYLLLPCCLKSTRSSGLEVLRAVLLPVPRFSILKQA